MRCSDAMLLLGSQVCGGNSNADWDVSTIKEVNFPIAVYISCPLWANRAKMSVPSTLVFGNRFGYFELGLDDVQHTTMCSIRRCWASIEHGGFQPPSGSYYF